MIARQRANLKRTFVQAELPVVESRVMPRLAQNQRELTAATADFTQGYESRFGSLPCLHEAQEAMAAAARALDAKNAKDGRASESTALANLIKARQNLRKLLSQNGGQASACRSFDNEQSQKIRPPKKNDEQEKERLAQLEQEISALAKEERKFSEEIPSSSGGGAKMERLGQRQDAAAKKAEELQQLTNKDDALTELSRERMEAGARSIKSSAQAMHAGREREAGKQAADAADQLERLARQVAALKPPELANRLAGTQNLAQQLARQEQHLGEHLHDKKTSADRDPQAKIQEGLTEEGHTLADLLTRNLADAAEMDSELARSLREAAENHPPGRIADQMGRAAAAIRAAQSEQARRDVTDAANRLDALAQQLDSVRRSLTQPQLEKLMAAEKQAAETQKALNAVANQGAKAEVEKKLTDLRETLDALQASDDKLADAAQALAQATRQGGNHWASSDGPTPRRGYRPPTAYDQAVTRTIEALQTRIQELILKDILLDKDEAVPPQYKKYVDEYYRTLSEDLRK